MAQKSVFQRLYDSEINFKVKVSCFWDCGFQVALGDELNGWKAEGTVNTWAEVEPWLEASAKRLYPDSEFVLGDRFRARRMHGRVEDVGDAVRRLGENPDAIEVAVRLFDPDPGWPEGQL